MAVIVNSASIFVFVIGDHHAVTGDIHLIGKSDQTREIWQTHAVAGGMTQAEVDQLQEFITK